MSAEALLDRMHPTDFQRSVLLATAAIPAGSTSTYTEIAKRIGRPRAVRAVGSALASNPLPFFIPCHRVLRSDGGLGGYRFGLALKAALLAQEGVPESLLRRPALPAGRPGRYVPPAESRKLKSLRARRRRR